MKIITNEIDQPQPLAVGKDSIDLLNEIDVTKSPTPLRGGIAERWNNPKYKVLKICELAKICKAITDNNYQVIMVVSGMTGVGKSSFANLLAREFNKQNGKSFRIAATNYYDNKSFYDAVMNCENKTSIVADEAVNILYKRDSATKENKATVKLFDMIRYKNLLSIFAVPSLWSLDSHMRNTQITFWVHITKRKLGWIFIPTKNMFSQDPWNQGYNEQALRKRFVPSNSDNFFAGIYFDKMPKDIEDVYLKHKEKMSALSSQRNKEFIYSHKQVEKIISTTKQQTKWVTISYLRDKELLSPQTVGVLAEEEGLTVQAINTRLTKMRKHFVDTKTLSELDVREDEIIEDNTAGDIDFNDETMHS